MRNIGNFSEIVGKIMQFHEIEDFQRMVLDILNWIFNQQTMSACIHQSRS